MTSFLVQPGPLAEGFERACRRLEQQRFAEALWSRRIDVWTSDSATQQKIAGRLGWLAAVDFVRAQLPRLRSVAATIKDSGVTHIVHLGMGGSSLAPEVLRAIAGVQPGFPRFQMLDSVDPAAVRDAMHHAATALFIVASKSGSTIEPTVMAAEARRRVEAAGIADWGSHFMAITDEDTVLHRHAREHRFRDIFINPADIGGRYSALSFFGMVPAALMGLDIEGLLAAAAEMETACRSDDAAMNPGLALGALMAAGAQAGRDKLTVLLPPRAESFGLWIEQLVAESTGKQGVGVVPIAGEPADAPFFADRMGVCLRFENEAVSSSVINRARAAEMPLALLDAPEATALGAEFLRWEVATAAAGFLLDINPFDEPNVQQAKDATQALLAMFAREQRLPLENQQEFIEGSRVAVSAAVRMALGAASPLRLLRTLRPSDYLALLAYLPPADETFAAVIRRLRAHVARMGGCATMAGYGPRYLHSTGQLHKGGANNGVFLIITAQPDEDLAIPGETFSFATLEMAQALGDFQSLDRAGRRAVHLHLPRREPELIQMVAETILSR